MAYALRMNGGVLRIEFSGTLTNQDLAEAGEQVGQLEQSVPIVPHRITDLRPIERLQISFDGVYALAVSRRRITFGNPFKSAIVTSDIAHFGYARMYQTLNDHHQICISIFGTDEEAMKWLEAPGQAPPLTEFQPPWP